MSKKSKFEGPFLPVPKWVNPYLRGEHIAKAVLMQYLVHMDGNTKITSTSYKYVADQVGIDRRTCIRATKKLEDIGVLVKTVRRSPDKENNLSNLYKIVYVDPNAKETVPLHLVSEETLGVVSRETLGGVTGDTRGGVTGDTRGGVTGDTQTRITKTRISNKNYRIKREDEYGDLEVDRRAL